jgi:hypothetical protein
MDSDSKPSTKGIIVQVSFLTAQDILLTLISFSIFFIRSIFRRKPSRASKRTASTTAFATRDEVWFGFDLNIFGLLDSSCVEL